MGHVEQEQLDRATLLLKAIGDTQAKFIASREPREAFTDLLDILLRITDSEYGFIGEVLTSESESLYLKTQAISNISWNDETRKLFDAHERSGLEFRNLESLFGAMLKSGKTVIANSPAKDPRRGGLPDGHPPLNAFLGLPIYAADDLVGMVGVANRPGGYHEGIVKFLEPLLLTCSNILIAHRSEASRRAAETERRHVEELEQIERQRAEEQFRIVFDHAPNGIVILDVYGRIELLNKKIEELFGYSREELIGQPGRILAPERFHQMHIENRPIFVDKTARGETIEGWEMVAMRKDGSEFEIELNVNPIEMTEGRMMLVTVVDVTERNRLQTQIKHQAFHDSLTGLPNRMLFMDRLGVAQARAKRHGEGVAVIFIDLDNFKIINDSLGHQAGDQFLMGVAERLRACTRPEDSVARLGGDEFTILLEELKSVEDAINIAERIVEAIRQPLLISNSHSEVMSTGSVGIAYSAHGEELPETLLRDADTAMYHAKDNGKAGYIVFNSQMNSKAVERMELEMGLRRALDRNEFRMHYQPIINLFTGTVSGVEALIRWEHPTRGLVSPDQFIPIAEETGLIAPIGLWALECACRQIREWRDRFCEDDIDLTMSVNLSGKQLQRRDVVESVAQAFQETGVEAKWIKLEITESVLMHDVEDVIGKLRCLRALGVKLAVDDFGTGYSSMSSLSAFPVDTVKIDRTFISRLGVEDDAEAIVAAIIMLSKSIKLESTAEGLENEEQLMFLKALGCSCAQGYYFARPLPPADCGDWLAAHLAESRRHGFLARRSA